MCLCSRSHAGGCSAPALGWRSAAQGPAQPVLAALPAEPSPRGASRPFLPREERPLARAGSASPRPAALGGAWGRCGAGPGASSAPPSAGRYRSCQRRVAVAARQQGTGRKTTVRNPVSHHNRVLLATRVADWRRRGRSVPAAATNLLWRGARAAAGAEREPKGSSVRPRLGPALRCRGTSSRRAALPAAGERTRARVCGVTRKGDSHQ